MSLHPYEILIRPMLTEKAGNGAAMIQPQYTFKVAIGSNKVQIRRAVEAAFDVKVVNVNTLRMKGKRKPMLVHELVGHPSEVSLPKRAAMRRYADGLQHYRAAQFEQAIALFKSVLEALPEDRAAQVLLERCRIYQANPPPANWDGVLTMTHK